jgi:hypothetical protein
MCLLLVILLLLVFSIRLNVVEWSLCSRKYHPGYTYHIRSDDQSVELRRCFEQDVVCNNEEREQN